jgi:hypothetical protein
VYFSVRRLQYSCGKYNSAKHFYSPLLLCVSAGSAKVSDGKWNKRREGWKRERDATLKIGEKEEMERGREKEIECDICFCFASVTSGRRGVLSK